MQRILVLNPKGGSGKTTIATNLASYFASQGDRPLLSDNDPQGSSARWLKKRTPEQPFIHGLAAFDRNSRMTRAWQMRIPARCDARGRGHARRGAGAGHAGDDQERRRHHRTGPALGHRHSRLLEMHRRPAADRQGAARRESHVRGRQQGQAQYADLSSR